MKRGVRKLMIRVVCGLAGSGKTTYVRNNKKDNQFLLDLDLLKVALNHDKDNALLKKIQLELLKHLAKLNYDIWYIVCYPSLEEYDVLLDANAEFILINTDIQTCKKNLEIRKQLDINYPISEILEKNRKLSKVIENSYISFMIIDSFANNEKWE